MLFQTPYSVSTKDLPQKTTTFPAQPLFSNASQPLELYQNLLQRLHLADLEAYACVDVQQQAFSFLSANLGDLFGLGNSVLMQNGPSALLPLYYPEDRSTFLRLSETTKPIFQGLSHQSKLDCRYNFDLRINRHDGSYARVLFLCSFLSLGENELPAHCLIRYFDISSLKLKEAPMMVHLKAGKKTIGLWLQNEHGNLEQVSSLLTKTETKIADLMAKGLSTQEIAIVQKGNLETIDLHRRRICNKTGSKNGMAFGILKRLGAF